MFVNLLRLGFWPGVIPRCCNIVVSIVVVFDVIQALVPRKFGVVVEFVSVVVFRTPGSADVKSRISWRTSSFKMFLKTLKRKFIAGHTYFYLSLVILHAIIIFFRNPWRLFKFTFGSSFSYTKISYLLSVSSCRPLWIANSHEDSRTWPMSLPFLGTNDLHLKWSSFEVFLISRHRKIQNSQFV